MADLATKFGLAQAVTGGIMGGVKPPLIMPGEVMLPPHCLTTSSAVTMTASRIYYIAFRIEHIHAFAGAKTFNTGTGDNGKKVKIAIYSQAATGGPGDLLKDFGEITLTSAAAIRTLASSWTPTEEGWVYGAICSDTDPAMLSMGSTAVASGAGALQSPGIAMSLSGFPAEVFTTLYGTADAMIGKYAAGTYASFPAASAVAPTNSLYGREAFMPAFGFYR